MILYLNSATKCQDVNDNNVPLWIFYYDIKVHCTPTLNFTSWNWTVRIGTDHSPFAGVQQSTSLREEFTCCLHGTANGFSMDTHAVAKTSNHQLKLVLSYWPRRNERLGWPAWAVRVSSLLRKLVICWNTERGTWSARRFKTRSRSDKLNAWANEPCIFYLTSHSVILFTRWQKEASKS